MFGEILTFVLLNVPEELPCRKDHRSHNTECSVERYDFHTVHQQIPSWQHHSTGVGEIENSISNFEPIQETEPNPIQIHVTRNQQNDVARNTADLFDGLLQEDGLGISFEIDVLSEALNIKARSSRKNVSSATV